MITPSGIWLSSPMGTVWISTSSPTPATSPTDTYRLFNSAANEGPPLDPQIIEAMLDAAAEPDPVEYDAETLPPADPEIPSMVAGEPAESAAPR